MFRNLFFLFMFLALAFAAVAQEAKDPLLRHRSSQSERRLKTSGGTSRSTVAPVITSGTKPVNLNAQLSQLERETVKSQAPNTRGTNYPTVLPKKNNSANANPPVNFQYHPPKATTTTQPSSGSGGAARIGGVHRVH